MATEEQAQAAIDALHDQDFMGRTIAVNVAQPKA
jgi:RNA recognition motif-containing protein